MAFEGLRKINPEALRQIDRVFVNRWEVFVIASLAAGPLRFSQLAFQVQMVTKKRVSDSSLSRINRQLVRAEMIQLRKDADGPNVYALTPRGERVARMLAAITEALDELQADHDGGQSARMPQQRSTGNVGKDKEPGLTAAES